MAKFTRKYRVELRYREEMKERKSDLQDRLATEAQDSAPIPGQCPGAFCRIYFIGHLLASHGCDLTDSLEQ